MTYAYARGRCEIDREFPAGKAPETVRHKGKTYRRVRRFGTCIKYRHRAVGDDEDRAFKQAAVDSDRLDHEIEASQKKAEQEKKG